MCGILGILSANAKANAITADSVPWLSDRDAMAARDTMRHRGPDDAGLIRDRARSGAGFVLGHRRLAVVDPSPLGHQPMCLDRPDGTRRWLVYNGELYNDHDLRADMQAAMRASGRQFQGTCDAETLLFAVETYGVGALERLRGMYAFASIDTRSGEVLLARDPLGIKPLYVHTGMLHRAAGLVFASELPAILAVPGVPCLPDWITVSAYLTTIRTTLGERTLFAGIETLEPGEHRVYRLGFDAIEELERGATTIPSDPRLGACAEHVAEDLLRDVVGDAVRSHLRSDVPMCSLLSGGLDSSIIVYETMRHTGTLATYCAGSREIARIDGVPQSDDFRFASEVGTALGTSHTEVDVSGSMFAQRWGWMIGRLGVPLSTPNEVAIHKVAQACRGAGHVVALSGEGADELFAGYVGPLVHAAQHAGAVLAGTLHGDAADGGLCELNGSNWAPLNTKPALLTPVVLDAIRGDEVLRTWSSRCFADAMASASDRADPSEQRLEAHLRYQRRVNLSGLLARLDTATMLASVEGRTPFADIRVASMAMGAPVASKCRGLFPSAHMADLETKRVLRRAYRNMLPALVVDRPKASFPLPFQHWLGTMADRLHVSLSTGPAGGVFTPEALAFVHADPSATWRFAWPMLNIAMWLDRWWGESTPDGLITALVGRTMGKPSHQHMRTQPGMATSA